MAIDILVCNLTRLGDLLQTQPLIDDLRGAGYRVGLACLENFASAASMLRGVASVWPFPGARVSADLDRNWPDALGDILRFSEKIWREGSPRFVLNLTPTLPGRLLSRLICGQGPQPLGFGLDAYGFGVNHGFWASFLAVAAKKRVNAPFNLADMLRRVALPLLTSLNGSPNLAPPPGEAREFAKKLLAGHPANGFIAFQLGASEERRRWPVASFRQLGRIIHQKTGYVPVLLGSESESGLGVEFAEGADYPWINAIGRTDIPQLGAVLLECALLVTNDTGTMHLAAGLGIPSLAFFLATAQPWDTGPLLPGCCCLEPALPCHPCAFGSACGQQNKCRRSISPEAAADLVLAWLQDGDWNNGLTQRVNERCRVWITRRDTITTVSRAGNQEDDDRGLWLAWLREFWRQLLDEMDRSIKGQMDGNSQGGKTIFPERAPVGSEAAIATLEQGASILGSLQDCGDLLTRSPAGAQIFLRNCERLQAVLDDCPALDTLGSFWRELRRNHGPDISTFLPLLPIMAENFKKFGKGLADKVA